MATRMPPRDDRVIVCKVCRIGVQKVETFDPRTGVTQHLGWQHARPTTPHHDPEPIELSQSGGEIRTVCDICGEPDPQHAWETAQHEFVIQPKPESGNLIFRDRGDMWLICNRCAPLVNHNDVHGLFRRRLTVIKETTPERRIPVLERQFIFERIRDFLETRKPEPTERTF
jgi:hypothetical protein